MAKETRDIERRVDEVARLAKENHRILTKINRRLQTEHFWRIAKFVIIVALLFGAYYAIQPFIENLQNSYRDILQGFEEIQQQKNSVTDGFNSLFNRNSADVEVSQ